MATEKNKLGIYFENIGNLISKFRKERKLSLEELGFMIGIDRSNMHKIERGKPVTVTTIVKLSLALDKTPKDFFDVSFDLKSHELGGLTKQISSPKRKPKQGQVKKAPAKAALKKTPAQKRKS